MGRCCYVFLRGCHDVSIRRRGDVPLRRLGDVPSRRRWVFHLKHTSDVAGSYRELSLRRRHNIFIAGWVLMFDVQFRCAVAQLSLHHLEV